MLYREQRVHCLGCQHCLAGSPDQESSNMDYLWLPLLLGLFLNSEEKERHITRQVGVLLVCHVWALKCWPGANGGCSPVCRSPTSQLPWFSWAGENKVFWKKKIKKKWTHELNSVFKRKKLHTEQSCSLQLVSIQRARCLQWSIQVWCFAFFFMLHDWCWHFHKKTYLVFCFVLFQSIFAFKMSFAFTNDSNPEQEGGKCCFSRV